MKSGYEYPERIFQMIIHVDTDLQLSAKGGRRVWAITKAPTDERAVRDVASSKNIRRASEPTGRTGEQSSRLTVGLVNTTTRRAGTGRIARVYRNTRDTRKPCLVLNELSELEKGPGMVLTPLRPADRDPFSDTAQVLKGDTSESVMGFRHHLFRDAMVYRASEAALLQPSLSEKPFGRARSLALKSSTKSCVAFAEAVDLPTAVRHTIRVGQDVDDTQVTTEEALDCHRRRLGGFDNLVDIEPSIAVHQSGFVLTGKDNARTGYEGITMTIEKHGAISLVPMFVEWDTSQGTEHRESGTSGLILVGRGDFANGNGSLDTCKSISLSQPMVGTALKGKPGEDTLLEGDPREAIACAIKLPHHGKESGVIPVYRHYMGKLHRSLIVTGADLLGKAGAM